MAKRGFIKTTDLLLIFYLLMTHVLLQSWMNPTRTTDYARGITFGKIKKITTI